MRVPLHVCEALGAGSPSSSAGGRGCGDEGWRNVAGGVDSGLSQREVRNIVAGLARLVLEERRKRKVSDDSVFYAVMLCRASLEAAVASLAALDSGSILVPLNWRWTKREAAQAISQVLKNAPFVLLCDAECEAFGESLSRDFRETCAQRVTVLCHLPAKAERRRMRGVEAKCADPKEEDGGPRTLSSSFIGARESRHLHLRMPGKSAPIAAILFTSGTSSRKPKGAALTHTAFLEQAQSKISMLGYSSTDCHVHCAPLHHVSGLCALVTAIRSGSRSHVFVPKFSPEDFVRAVRSFQGRGRPRVCVLAVPAMVIRVSNHLGTPPTAQEGLGTFPEVRLGLLGGEAAGALVAKICANLFPRARVYATYGMTEACSSIAIKRLGKSEGPLDRSLAAQGLGGQFVGAPCPHIDVGLLLHPRPQGEAQAKESGRERREAAVSLEPRHVGEILVRGPSVCAGYVAAPGRGGGVRLWKSELSQAEGGAWFPTGDLGWLDDSGGVHICGRMSEAIRSGGEMIYPSELEREINSCRALRVEESLVFGVDDQTLGQRACALVVLDAAHDPEDPGATGTRGGGAIRRMSSEREEILRAFLRNERSIASYRIPRTFLQGKEAFPRNGSGKVEREKVKEEARECLAQSERVVLAKL